MKGGSGASTVKDNTEKTTSRGEKWTKGEVDALLDAYEYNYVESERPNHGKLQWEYCANEVNNKLERSKNAFFSKMLNNAKPRWIHYDMNTRI